MCKKLFDDFKRTDTDLANYSEPHFSYINRTNRDDFREIRGILEKWFAAYERFNIDSAKDLCNRFRSKDNEQHLAALTELYLHNLLLKNGFKPVAHPHIEGKLAKPDFFAYRREALVFAVEAVLVYGEKVTARLDKFEANINDAINAVNSPDFLISYQIDMRDANTQPKVSSITSFLQKNIDKLNYERVCREYEESMRLPEWPFIQGDWKLTFSASPVTEEARKIRGSNSGVISTIVHGAMREDIDTAIRDNVIMKSKKYGKFEMPFIIFINVARKATINNDDIIMDALCGKEVYEIAINKNGNHTTKARRDMKGIWTDPRAGIANPHISGLIFISGLSSGTILSAKPVLWHHPFSSYPFDRSFLDVEQRYFDKESGRLGKYNVK